MTHSVEDGTIIHSPRKDWNGDPYAMEICVGSDCKVDRVKYAHYKIESRDNGFLFTYIPDDDEVKLPKPTVTAHDAASFWGSAQNVAYPLEQRLQLALAALEFFGGEYEKWDEIEFEPTRWRRILAEDGSLWMESSDEVEVRAAAKKGLTPQRLYVKTMEENEWRDI